MAVSFESNRFHESENVDDYGQWDSSSDEESKFNDPSPLPVQSDFALERKLQGLSNHYDRLLGKLKQKYSRGSSKISRVAIFFALWATTMSGVNLLLIQQVRSKVLDAQPSPQAYGVNNLTVQKIESKPTATIKRIVKKRAKTVSRKKAISSRQKLRKKKINKRRARPVSRIKKAKPRRKPVRKRSTLQKRRPKKVHRRTSVAARNGSQAIPELGITEAQSRISRALEFQH